MDQHPSRRGQVHSLAAARADHLARELRSKLADYLRTEETEWTISRGLSLFFPVELFDEEQVEPEALGLATDWVAFCFVTEWGDTLAHGLATSQDSLSPLERETLSAWADQAAPGFFRVAAVSGSEAKLSRLPDDRSFTVRTLGAELKPGELVAAWLLPVGPQFYFGLHEARLVDSVADRLSHVLQVEMALLRRQRPAATWDDLYRTSWPRIIWYLFSLGSGADVCRIAAPPGPPVRWEGRRVEGAPDWWEQTASLVRMYADSDCFGPSRQADGAERLWWDAALALQPRQARPDSWAAGILYIFRRKVLGDASVTQAGIAEELQVSANAVGSHSRRVAAALGVEPYDLRYADLLDPDVRVLWEMRCLSALGSPEMYGGMDLSAMPPDELLALHGVLRTLGRQWRR